MSDSPTTPAPPPPARPHRPLGPRLAKVILGSLRRLYLAALIALILWLSFGAFSYLLTSLLLAPQTPAQVVDLPALTADDLTRSAGTFAGLRATPNPREPLAHYHRFGAWFEPDGFNDCTRSGCHGALPHHRNKESRAFLNMHATSIHCGVCHFQSESAPLDLIWYDLRTGGQNGPPAPLRALAWQEQAQKRLGADEKAAFTSAEQREIVALLREADARSGLGNFAALAAHMEAVRADSDDFRDLVRGARDTIMQHLRGEYGEKIAVRGTDGKPILKHLGGEAAAAEFLARGDSLSPIERGELLGKVHTLRAPQTRHCTDCHRQEGSLLDLPALGYPATRIDALTRSMLMQAIERIMSGEPLYLPGFVGSSDDVEGR